MLHPAMAAMNPLGLPFQQRPGAGAITPAQFQQSFFFPGPQQPMSVHQRPRTQPRPATKSGAAAPPAAARKQCNCKNSRCLKL